MYWHCQWSVRSSRFLSKWLLTSLYNYKTFGCCKLSIWSNDHVFTSPHKEISLHDHCDLEMHVCKTQHLHHCIQTLALCVTTMVHVTFGTYSAVPVWEMRKDLNETRCVLRQTRFIGDPGNTFCLYNLKHGYFKYQEWTYSPFWSAHVLVLFTHIPYLMNIIYCLLHSLTCTNLFLSSVEHIHSQSYSPCFLDFFICSLSLLFLSNIEFSFWLWENNYWTCRVLNSRLN